MFTLIIVVLGIIIYLSKINNRIFVLEQQIKKININNLNHKDVDIKQSVYKADDISISEKTSVEKSLDIDKINDDKKINIENHQDNFAQNLAKFGITILVFGILFFLGYIDSQGLIGPVFKYVSGLIFGVILLAVAEYIKNKNKKYTNILRGASFIIFYITLFVGYLIFNIVSLPITLSLITLVLILSSAIAIKENDHIPFTFGVVGAYFIPFLMDVNTYNMSFSGHVSIMYYLLILNTAIIFISYKKSWLHNTVIGFIFTWIIFLIIKDIFPYINIHKNTLFIFSTLYALQYLIIFLIQDFKNVKSHIFIHINNLVLLTVINTIIYLIVFYDLIKDTFLLNYIGFFVVTLGVFHFVIYVLLKTLNKNVTNIITLTHFVVSILLVSVAIPLQFDGPIVTMIWFIEGVVLSFLSILKDFKNKSIMYVLGFIAIISGIIHMISFGVYDTVMKNGLIFFNQSYIVWFFVFILINCVSYIWYKTVSDSENMDFKNSINKLAFVFIIIGQIMFIALTSVEIKDFNSYRVNNVYKEIQKDRELDNRLNSDNYNFVDSKYDDQYKKISTINTQSTFMQLLLFIIMTIIYFLIGLIKKNKIVRNMGIITLTITSILLLGLTWNLGPVYRIITFIGFGIALLIVSYLYISKNKKNNTDLIKTLILLCILGFTLNIDAKVINTDGWTTFTDIKISELKVESDSGMINDNKNLYILPLGKDVVNLSKKNDLSDIRIIDKDKNEIPYIIVKSDQSVQSVKQEKNKIKILENVLLSGNKKVLVLDTGREGMLYNRLFLTHDDKSINFRKKVKVYISDIPLNYSSVNWGEIEQKNVIYNYTDKDNFSVEKMNIDLTGVSSRYVKIELIDDKDFDKEIKTNNKLNINEVYIEYVKDEYNEIGLQVKDYLSGKFSFDDLEIYKDVKLLDVYQKDNRTEVIYEGGIDIQEFILNIDISNKNFNRNIVIQGSNDDINWDLISNGNIYRIDSPVYKGEQLNIKIPVSTYKKIKFIIQDDNNKPLDFLKISKVKIQNIGLLFKLEDLNISDIKLILGNNTEPSPIYDIKSVINYFENVTPKVLKYDNLIKNPDYKPVKNIIPFGERNKVFLNIGLIIFIIIMGIFGFFWMKKDTNHEIK